MNKNEIRKKYFLRRKNNYFQIKESFFNPLISVIRKKFNNINKNISIYYPSSFEVDVLKILNVKYFSNFKFLLPVIEDGNIMNFYKWKKEDILFVNRLGIPEPTKSNKTEPDLVLVPLLAFDKNKNRLGYGKGFYDRYLKKYLKKNKKILTVGIAFSFQEYKNLPVNKNDYKLDYIITEKGIK